MGERIIMIKIPIRILLVDNQRGLLEILSLRLEEAG